MGIKNKLLKWLTSDLEHKTKFNGIISNFQDNNPVWSDWSIDNAIKNGMKSSTYVYSCINLLMTSVSSIPWNAYTKNSKGEWEEAHNHPLEQLIQEPNPFTSRQQLIETITAHLYLGGNAILQKVKTRGMVTQVWAIAPDAIKPVPSKINYISRYEYRNGAVKKDFKPDEIVHFMFTDPSNPYWGFSPIQAGARTIDTDIEAVEWNKVAMQNRAVSDGVFTFKEQFISQEQWEDARKQVRDQHQGSKNARNPWVLGGDAQWQPMSSTPVEMDFINSRKMTVQEICSIFQVPPPMIGIYENATLANIETARKIFWIDTIIPFLDKIQDTFNRVLAPEFGDNVWIGYDISNVQALQENLGEKITNAKDLFAMGVPFNQINERLELGFDSLDGGNSGYLPMNLMPTSFKPDNETIEVIEEEDDDKLSKLFKEVETKLELVEGEKKYTNLQTTEQKEMHWKRVDGRRQKWESKVGKMIGKQFSKESKEVIKAFKSGGLASANRAVAKQTKNWEKLFTAFYINVMEDFGDEAADSVSKQAGIKREVKFDAYDEGVRDWIEYMVGRNIKNISQTTRDRIKRETGIGFDNGEDSQQIAARLQGLYKHMEESRAMTIARTEIGSAMNAGSHFAIEQTGLKYDRVWLSSLDDRTRESHEDMDGEVAEGDEPFDVNGSEMMFPGDSSMGADELEIINCRCVETYEVRS